VPIGIKVILLKVVERFQDGKDSIDTLHEIQDIDNLFFFAEDCLVRGLAEELKEIFFD